MKKKRLLSELENRLTERLTIPAARSRRAGKVHALTYLLTAARSRRAGKVHVHCGKVVK